VRLIPSSRSGALARFAIGAVIVIVFTATTTAVAGLLQFKQAAKDISVTPAIKHADVTIANPGNPQTILIIGSDHRAGTPFYSANTDTMMLVRLDPASYTINVLSIPRDLQVQIPVGGSLVTAKLNSAYSAGGPNLLLRVLRGQVFPELHVNHIIDINFGGFEALVNAIGCVYTDVDHRYYNNTALTDYSSINLQAGYQKLCGADALSFVRFRHTDNDIVRNARQQDFIRWAKNQFPVSTLLSSRDTLLKIFGAHTQTDPDLHTVDGLINLFNLVAFADSHTIKQIQFPAIILPCTPQQAKTGNPPCYVTADPGAEQHAFNMLMTPTVARPANAAGGSHGGPAPVSGGSTQAGAPATVLDPADGRAQVAALGSLGFPIYYPKLIASGSSYEPITPGEYPRGYQIHDQGGVGRPSYRMVLALNPTLGQYYGVQGTTWLDPPILRNPNQTRLVNGKRLSLYLNGRKLAVVGWRTPRGDYWISNTLTDTLSNQQMVAIAASLTRA
jgi:polyisoprenyl-teichoic acid--peptidoglycan teichoic acid transferase